MSPVLKHSVTKDTDEIDIGRIIGELIDHRKLIISVTALFTVLALVYALFATPIYKADALVQVEQKQGNAILSNLSQMLPNSQPMSAPEIALLQSRMILGKTVDDLNLQSKIEPKYFPIFGKGLSRLMGEKNGTLEITRLYIPIVDNEASELEIEVKDQSHYFVKYNNKVIEGTVGIAIDEEGVSLKVSEISAKPGSRFTVKYEDRLKAISDLQDVFTVADQGKDTGILTLSLTGDNPILIRKIVDSIAQNYLSQNIARQAAQDEKSLEFLNIQLPKVRKDLDIAEDTLNQYRRQKDSVDLSLEAKSVLEQIVNVDNQLNELTFRESEISQLYTKEHPTYKALLEKRKTLQDEKEKLNNKVSAMPKTQQEILRLSRDVESGQAVYMQLLNRQQELNIAKSSAIGNVRIIDTAITQTKPVKPKKILIVLIGVFLGLVGFIASDDHETNKSIINNIPVLPNDIEWLKNKNKNTQFIVAVESSQSEIRNTWLRNFMIKGYRYVSVIPTLRGMPLDSTDMSFIFSHEVMIFRVQQNLAKLSSRLIKRIFDIIGSISIIILLSPILIYISRKVKEDGGPAIYGHERIGKGGKPFKCLKFRSMVINSKEVLEELLLKDINARKEWEETFKLKNDPRVTKIGAFLRRTSLDELPQLFNVLKGEMSLVGPRPIITAELERYNEEVDYYLLSKPGMTGLWQVSGRSDVDYETRVYLDAWYVKNWSMWNDIAILFKTIGVVLKKDGAY
nr:undecaprenyl-phosphate galactose phosphotransferase WbaP [Klebsiella pneumoniae]